MRRIAALALTAGGLVLGATTRAELLAAIRDELAAAAPAAGSSA